MSAFVLDFDPFSSGLLTAFNPSLPLLNPWRRSTNPLYTRILDPAPLLPHMAQDCRQVRSYPRSTGSC
uniref:Uncharacterized protein n=1 Tax=Rhizophora mucronata TaxID=61149 RepID=A0A2P2J5Z8_RHIMU